MKGDKDDNDLLFYWLFTILGFSSELLSLGNIFKTLEPSFLIFNYGAR